MIARLQKSRLLERLLLQRLQEGRFPDPSETLDDLRRLLGNRRPGEPLTRFRPAFPGRTIGGPDGEDLQRLYVDLREDLEVLYQALIDLTVRGVDLYELFAVRRDLLSLKLNQLDVDAGTLLAQVAAGSRASVSESFNTLDQLDLDRTNAFIDLDAGVATLKPDTTQSTAYSGSAARVVRTQKPAGTVEPGSPFAAVFSPYRATAWYAELPPGGEYEAHVSVTGADYQQGDGDEILLNALRLHPTGPCRVRVDWSPDSYNWHPLDPLVDASLTEQRTFHFTPVQVGYLRIRLRAPESAAGRTVVGLKRVDLLRRGYNQRVELYSQAFEFDQPIHTVVATLDATAPVGTWVRGYVSQGADGPWLQVGPGPITFGTVLDQRVPLTVFTPETANGRFFEATVPDRHVLPESGELWAGQDQARISAYPFDWSLRMERDRLPAREDWENPLGIVRSGAFRPRGSVSSNQASPSGWTDDRNPLAVAEDDGETYLVLAVVGEDGEFVLQPGYNYRFTVHLWCPTPQTLEGQRIGLVNPADTGGVSTAIVAPHSLYLNGTKVYERQTSILTPADMNEPYQATLPMQQGWNALELLVQVPVDLAAQREDPDSGVASGALLLYFQPNVFRSDAATALGITEVRAYAEPWKKKSEFDLRYNVAPNQREYWAWKLNADGSVSGVLFNHNPANPTSGDAYYDADLPFYTIDGVNAGKLDNLALRYTIERTDLDEDYNPRRLYFRAELGRDPDANGTPELASYRLICN